MINLNKYLCSLFLFVLSSNCYATESLWKQSILLEKQGKYKLSADKIKPKVNANNEFAILRVAYLTYMQGKNTESISYYENAININSNSIDAKLGIMLPLMAQKRWRQVKSFAHQILRFSHWNYTAHTRLMLAEEGLQMWESLEKHASQLVRVYPSDANALVYLARARAWQGNKTAAKTAYQQVLSRIPGHHEALAFINKN